MLKLFFGLGRKTKLITAIMLVILGSSCTSLKYVPSDEYLLNDVKIRINNPEFNRDNLYPYIRQRENTRILGFLKFHLWLYNLSSPVKAESWLKKAGEPPQVYNQFLAEQSREQLRSYLFNKGYYDAGVDFKAEVHKRKRKIDISYNILTGNPYLIKNIDYAIKDSGIYSQYIKEYQPRSLKKDVVFDLEMLDRERNEIIRFFKNKGYYYFSKPMLFFEADTIASEGRSNLKMIIDLPESGQRDSSRIYRPYYVNHFTYKVLRGSQQPIISDTVYKSGYTFIFQDNLRFNPGLFMRLNRMKQNGLYNADNAENTFNALNRLRQFRFINIYFQEHPDSKDSALLDCYIDLSPLSKQSTSFDIEGTNTSGNFGIAGNMIYSHRNLFHGAEVLNLKLKGAMERQQAIVENQSLDFNTKEIGVEATFGVPRLIGPGTFFHFSENTLPKTLFTLGYNYQNRPDYTRTISTIKLGYDWMTSVYKQHNWSLLDFNMVNLSRFDPEFINSIYDLYIRESFTDHLILATNYTFVYNNQPVRTKENYTYIRFSAESSGNFLNLLSKVTGSAKTLVPDTSGLNLQRYYEFFHTRYAQYVRSDVEFRKGYWLNKYNSVVGRLFLGVGVPYGNFDVLPFEKKYFTGGANGIRAWQVRSLGPGTYRAPEGSYPNQSGDIKLEANVEYRFKLIKFLEGAFFLDAGNVWAINEKDNRAGAQFRPGQFYRQLAFGTGTGFRFDFDYFIFRLDLGLKVRDPAQTEKNGWIVGARKLKGSDFNFSFAIGYPF